MSLYKSRIPKLSDSSRKFIPEKQRKAMNDLFVERITRTRTDKGKKVSGRMVETGSQKSSEGQKARLEVEVHPDPAMDEYQEGHGPERRGNRRLASESTPVEQDQDFATSTGTLDREEMSKLSDISTENLATTRSPTDNTMMLGVTEKPETSSSFSERVKTLSETSFHLPWERVQAMKQKNGKKKRTMTGKMTLDLKSASIARLRRMTNTPIERLRPWTNLLW